MIPIGTNLRLKHFPWVTISILFLNWIIFISFSREFYIFYHWISQYFFTIPGEQYPWQLITSMFFHQDFFHILANSLFLLVFGPPVEDRLGWKEYLFLYIFTGIAAGLLHGMMMGLFLRDDLFIPALGASGAISGVMGIYLYRCHYSKVKLAFDLFLPYRIKIPAYIILPFWFLMDFIEGVESLQEGGAVIAFWAHVGGFLAGFGSSWYLENKTKTEKERLEFVAESTLESYTGYGEGIKASEKLLEKDPDNPELHLSLARAKTRFWATPDGRLHYEKAIRSLLKRDPQKAMEVFIEYWEKYLDVLEAKDQVRISLLLSQNGQINLSALTLQKLILSDPPLDPHLEKAYLILGRIYDEQLGRKDLARSVYERYLVKFPESKSRLFFEKKFRSALKEKPL